MHVTLSGMPVIITWNTFLWSIFLGPMIDSRGSAHNLYNDSGGFDPVTQTVGAYIVNEPRYCHFFLHHESFL